MKSKIKMREQFIKTGNLYLYILVFYIFIFIFFLHKKNPSIEANL